MHSSPKSRCIQAGRTFKKEHHLKKKDLGKERPPFRNNSVGLKASDFFFKYSLLRVGVGKSWDRYVGQKAPE